MMGFCDHSAQALNKWQALDDKDACLICERPVPSSVLLEVEDHEVTLVLETLETSPQVVSYFDWRVKQRITTLIRKLLKSHASLLRMSTQESSTTGEGDDAETFPEKETKVPPLSDATQQASKTEREASTGDEKGDDVLKCEVVCPLSSEIPTEPVKLKNSPTLVVYDKHWLVKALDCSQPPLVDPTSRVSISGLDDYTDATGDVVTWVEKNLKHPRAQLWMFNKLLEIRTKAQVGETLMSLIRQEIPQKHLEFGPDIGTVVNNGESVRLEFSLSHSHSFKRKAIDEIKKAEQVIWVDECFDMRGKGFGTFVAVAVKDFEDALVEKIVSIARECDLQGTLTFFTMLPTPTPMLTRTLDQRRQARAWWAQHSSHLRDLLQAYPEVECAFLDPAVCGGTAITSTALVLVVPFKGFIAQSSKSLPTTFEGLRVDVRSGRGKWLSGTSTFAQTANNPQEKSTYIGQGVGKNQDNGTIGAIVTRQGQLFALTAARVVDGNDELLGPVDKFFRPSPTRKFGIVAVKRGLTHPSPNPTYVDALVLRCDKVVHADGSETLCNNQNCQPCFVPRTTCFPTETPSICYQSGAICDPSEDVFEYFGRTHMHEKVTFVLSEKALVKLTEGAIDDLGEKKTAYPEQLLLHAAYSNHEGDSGSVIWKRTNESLDAVALLWFQIAQPTSRFSGDCCFSEYLIATDIRRVLAEFDCQIVAHTATAATVPAAAATATAFANLVTATAVSTATTAPAAPASATAAVKAEDDDGMVLFYCEEDCCYNVLPCLDHPKIHAHAHLYQEKK